MCSSDLLLDWLATEFPRLGWSQKKLVRLIVTSSAYRQASAHRGEASERDARNILLSRQNRLRLEAEVVRDLNLAVSGLLHSKIGGPSVRPRLPAGVAELGYAGTIKWTESEGKDRYRRGMYVFFQRTVPYPMLTAFDAPDSNVACTRRERSNTPIQALTTLNDPVFFECAQALGVRLMREGGEGPEARLRYGVLLCLGRPAGKEEVDRLLQLHGEATASLRKDPAAAAKLVGTSKATAGDVVETAAMIVVGRVLTNLDEFVTRE